MIIIGSTALELHGLQRQAPKDFDVLVPLGTSIKGYDCIPVPKSILEQVPYLEYDWFDLGTKQVGKYKYATLDALLTLKASHCHLDVSWEKTKLDILWLVNNGASIIPELFKSLKTFWDSEKGRPVTVSLNKSSKEFFSTGSSCPYEHDQLHRWAKHPFPPTFTKCLVEGQEVLIDKEKFLSLPFSDQLEMIKEEIAVIACERWLLNPKSNITSLVHAWRFALKKVVTTLMKGFFSEFVITHLEKFSKVDFILINNILKFTEHKEKTMTELTKELIDLFKKHAIDGEDLEDALLYSTPPGVEIVEQEGGESEGEYAHTVWKYKDRFFRLDYSYYSYHGYDNLDVNEIREVHKKEKTIQVYE